MNGSHFRPLQRTRSGQPGVSHGLGRIPYKWIALSNTTLGVFMAGLDGTIVMISLPAIFKGIGINPLASQETNYLLWTLMGYMVVTATLLVTFGRISDMFGRVRLYNLGFTIFAVGSILLFLVTGTGNTAAMQIIIFRLIQAVGGAFLFSNSTAILTDAFPPDQRGTAMGINQIASLGGQLIGLVAGGLLAAVHWRAVFLVVVPFSVGGSIWAYVALHETAAIREHQKLDVPGNLLFAFGLTAVLVGVTYGLQPYRSATMGWANPFVLTCVIGGVMALAVFTLVERRVAQPMFRLELFRIRMFTAGNIALFLGSLARGGLNLMLIIWLQGIWLPLHGFSFEDTPLWAGIYMMPLTGGFLLAGPLCGHLSDRYGARFFSTTGMLVVAAAFLGLIFTPINFAYVPMAVLLLLVGIGMGMFAAPNTTAIMNSVPTEHRGASSGMRATFLNTANTLSMTMIFTVVTVGFAAQLPKALFQGLTAAGSPAAAARQVAGLPPTGAIFAAFLGYNPMATLLPGKLIDALSPANKVLILGKEYFPNLISTAFKSGLAIAFSISAALSVIAALASLMRGKRVIYGDLRSTGSPNRWERRDSMLEPVRFGRTGLTVTKIAFGGIPIQRVSRQDGVQLVRDALEHGVNFIDTAHGYGHSEELIGEAVQSVPRDTVVLSTISPAADAKRLLADLEESLRRLRTDHVDIYQLHGVSSKEKMEAVLGPGGAFEGMEEGIRTGKVRFAAFSSHNFSVAVEMIHTGLFAAVQIPFNLVDTEALDEVIPLARQADIGVIAMKPLGGGRLEDARLCFRFLLQFPDVIPDPGIETLSQLREILGVMESRGPLTAEENERIEQYRSRLGSQWCHRCDYCQPCPQHISISTLLVAETFAKRMPVETARLFVEDAFRTAENCEECRQCVERCPYHLDVPALLKKQRSRWDGYLKAGNWG